MRTRILPQFFLLLVAIAAVPAFAGEENPGELVQQAAAAYRTGDIPRALSLATQAIKAAPTQPQYWLLRAQIYDSQREYARAVADYSEVLKRDPAQATVWQRRGEAQFKHGKIAESLSDFDKFLSLVPERKPHHWQRGIALYYAGRYAEGKQQFELHQTVNSQDVENAVWHFLCTARADGLEAAKKSLIPIEQDARVPMAQVHQLFAGKARPSDVLAAAKAAPPQPGAGEPLFYAHLYLGLYYEALGDDKQTGEHIRKAAARAKENGYMGDVARVHAGILLKRGSKRGPPSRQKQPAPHTSRAASEDANVRFTILHLNDVYEITPVGGEGGLARVATLHRRLRENNPNTFMVLAGDLFSPSALGTARVAGERLAGKQIVAIMNAVGLGYATFGNHEFDPTEEQFHQRLKESRFRWFSSNAMDAQGRPFPNVPAYRILEVANRKGRKIKIGLFGLTIPSNPKPYVRYLDVFQEAGKQVQWLRPQVDALMAITHLAFDDDRKLAETYPQIDLILGGHEHIHHAFEKGNLAPIYKADANARTVYLHYFVYDTSAKRLKRTSILRPVTSDTPEDPAVKQEVAKWVQAAFDGFRKDGFQPEERVTISAMALDGTEESVRSGETDLTRLIAEGMLQGTEGAELAVYNGGAIRIDDTLPPGPITQYDVIRILPFGGKVLLVEIQGSLLQKALDQGVANRGIGGYLQTAGVTREAGGPGWRIAGAPLDPDRAYRVAILDFLLTGREQNLEYLNRDAPGVKVLREGSDIRQTTIQQLQRLFPPR